MGVESRFWQKVNKNGPVHPALGTRCWVWTGSTVDGYGNVKIGGIALRAHRWSYSKLVAAIPSGLCVLHRCDNRACVRPDHLFLGTLLDNSEDRDRKGRNVNPVGEDNGSCRLTEADVRTIRERYTRNSREHGTGALARQYGVSKNMISFIVRRINWRHV